jgi:DNA-binding response OmpR family regulator
MSGYPFDVITRHGGHHADAFYMEKPFTSHELLKMVRLALRGR